MKRLSLVVVALTLAVTALTPDVGSAFGRRSRGCDDCAPACGPTMKAVWTEKEVEVTEVVCKPRQETYKYTVCVPVTRDETRKVKVCQYTRKEVEHEYTVCVPVTTHEKRKVTVCKPSWKEVDVECTVMVPTTRTVTRMVPVRTCVPVTCTDSCGRCYTVCKTVCTMRETTCNVVVCEPKKTVVKRRVCEWVREEVEQTVPVCRYEHQKRTCKRVVCEPTWVEKDVTYKVCSYERQEREGTRTVYDRVENKVKRKVRVCEYVPCEAPAAAPVTTCSAPSCAPACNDCAPARCGGLFSRLRNRGCNGCN